MIPDPTLPRCAWCGTDPLYQAYHDTEWGVPERDPRALWELLILEGFQAGLSWITILRKRPAFRAAFAGFAPEVVAGWGAAEIDRLMGDAGIVRHRAKMAATIPSAQDFLKIEAQTGFADFVWAHVDGATVPSRWMTQAEVPARTVQSARLSKALRAAGFGYCGPTTTYAFMQAAGLVNDHLATCHRHPDVRG